jgi:hypothetical protein
MESYLTEVTGSGSFFDPIKAALGDVIDIYGQVTKAKLQNQLLKAQASAYAYDQATPQQDIQAIAQNAAAAAANNKMLVVGALLVGAVALFMIVKK